jgi:hypothetical protein
MTEWQPIETAPKDGTLVDLWSGLHGNRWTDYSWAAGRWWRYSFGYEPFEFNPTHWMPIPSPPTEKSPATP